MEADDNIDKLFDEIRASIIKLIAEGNKGEQGVDLVMISKYLERIGDHATNIAEWVEFSITGVHKGCPGSRGIIYKQGRKLMIFLCGG